MALHTAPNGLPAAPTASAAQRTSWVGWERRWLGAVVVGSLILLVALSAGLLLVQRQATLQLASAQAQREVRRLAAEIEQSLRLASAVVTERSLAATTGSDDVLHGHRALVQSLTLPFELVLAAPLPQAAPATTAQWLPGRAQSDAGRWYIPLRWHAPSAEPGPSYELRLSRDALLARFASEGLPPTGSMSLFRLEDDGATTILARHPTVEREQGLTVHGHVAAAVAQSPSGVIQVKAVIDGVERVVGYQQLGPNAPRLLVVYALPMDHVLAVWRSTVPVVALLTLLLAAGMAFGGWRLDRSMRALRDSERHFQTLTAHLPDVVTRYDAQGRLLYANPAIENAIGLSASAVQGRHLTDLALPAALTAPCLECLARVFASGRDETLYHTAPGPRGPRQWESRVMREPGMANEPPSVLVISRDITDQKAAESQRLAAQKLFEQMFQAAPEAVALSDWDSGQWLLVNDAFCELFGHARDSLQQANATDLDLWPPSHPRGTQLALLEAGEPVRDIPGRRQRPDGQTVEVRLSAERVEVDGHPRLLLLFRDVSQIERDQRALARSELRFRLAAEHGRVWEWDLAAGLAPRCDDFFLSLGYPVPSTTHTAEQLLALWHPDDVPQLRQLLHRFLKGEERNGFELRARDAQGEDRWFEVRGSAQRDAAGRATYMAGTLFEITDRKRLQEAQRHTLTQLETLASASPALLWNIDAQQHPNWFNQAWLDFTGRDFVGECEAFWLHDLHPQDQARCEEVFNRAFDAREPYSMEYRMRRHDGAYRWLLEQGRPRHDADQRFIGFIGSCLDVTDWRAAEAVARERGAMLEQVFGVLNDLLFVLDEQERFVYHQAATHDKLYRPPEAFMGRTITDVLPPALVQQMREAMARAREAGIQDIDYRLELPEGARHFSARLAWIPGQQQCMFLVRDVTERQAAQGERDRLNAFVLLLFRLANRFINLPVHQADEAINEALGDMGRFVDADRAYLFDYDMEAETASNTHEWCGDGVSPEIHNLQNLPFDLIPEWIGFHRIDQVMHVNRVADLAPGNLRDLLNAQGIQSLMAIPLSHGDRCLGFVGLDSVRHTHDYGEEETTLLRLFAQMLVNIRLRVEAAEKIQALTDGLEAKVAERTMQLEASVQELQTVNRELESFTYSASHDLRTPLRGIEGFCALLQEEHAHQLDAQGREYLQRIQRSTLHMSQLIHDLLAYARLEQMTERVEAVPVLPLVQSVAQTFTDALQLRRGQLQSDVAPGLGVMADPRALAMVLRNLLDNALKFTPAEREPVVQISARPASGGVELAVRDNGQGFDMRHHDRIFGMFQRLHRQDQIPGTGIGLALVHKAVARMGGRVWATSQVGEGSCFHLWIPGAPSPTLPAPEQSEDNTPHRL